MVDWMCTQTDTHIDLAVGVLIEMNQINDLQLHCKLWIKQDFHLDSKDPSWLMVCEPQAVTQ